MPSGGCDLHIDIEDWWGSTSRRDTEARCGRVGATAALRTAGQSPGRHRCRPRRRARRPQRGPRRARRRMRLAWPRLQASCSSGAADRLRTSPSTACRATARGPARARSPSGAMPRRSAMSWTASSIPPAHRPARSFEIEHYKRAQRGSPWGGGVMEVPKAPDLSSCESLRTALTPGSSRTSGPPRNHLKTKAAELPRIAPVRRCASPIGRLRPRGSRERANSPRGSRAERSCPP